MYKQHECDEVMNWVAACSSSRCGMLKNLLICIWLNMAVCIQPYLVKCKWPDFAISVNYTTKFNCMHTIYVSKFDHMHIIRLDSVRMIVFKRRYLMVWCMHTTTFSLADSKIWLHACGELLCQKSFIYNKAKVTEIQKKFISSYQV